MTYSETFEKAMEFIFQWEGGYVNDPDDPGGETKYGISKRQYPDLDIKHLTKEQAKEIYYKDYWLKAKCHKIEGLCERLAFVHFNCAINTGVYNANRILQKSINRQLEDSNLKLIVDGVVGPKTLHALEKCNTDFVFETYVLNLARYYHTLVIHKPRLRKFIVGWLNRTFDAYKVALEGFRC